MGKAKIWCATYTELHDLLDGTDDFKKYETLKERHIWLTNPADFIRRKVEARKVQFSWFRKIIALIWKIFSVDTKLISRLSGIKSTIFVNQLVNFLASVQLYFPIRFSLIFLYVY